MVLVHGFGASKDDATVVGMAEALAAEGHHVVSYTGRGHRESRGECTLGDLEHHDVAAASALAHATADRVVLVGASMGAVAVLRHAAQQSVAGVVTVSGPAEWRVPRTLQSAAAALITQTSPGRYLARRALGVRLAGGWSGAAAPVELAGSLRIPLAVVHGRADRFIRPEEAEKLHAAAGGPARLDLVEGMGHAYSDPAVGPVCRAVRWALEFGRFPCS